MRTAGGLLMALGAMMALFAYTMDTSVSTYGGGLAGLTETVNLSLLQNQMMVLHTGLAMFIAGAVLIAATRQAEFGTAISDETAEERYRRFDEEDLSESRFSFWLMIGGLVAAAIIIVLLATGAFA